MIVPMELKTVPKLNKLTKDEFELVKEKSTFKRNLKSATTNLKSIQIKHRVTSDTKKNTTRKILNHIHQRIRKHGYKCLPLNDNESKKWWKDYGVCALNNFQFLIENYHYKTQSNNDGYKLEYCLFESFDCIKSPKSTSSFDIVTPEKVFVDAKYINSTYAHGVSLNQMDLKTSNLDVLIESQLYSATVSDQTVITTLTNLVNKKLCCKSPKVDFFLLCKSINELNEMEFFSVHISDIENKNPSEVFFDKNTNSFEMKYKIKIGGYITLSCGLNGRTNSKKYEIKIKGNCMTKESKPTKIENGKLDLGYGKYLTVRQNKI